MRKNNIIITIDYETWQPVPDGKTINWKKDLVENTEHLMRTCERVGAKLTLMVEMCEYFWLLKNDKVMAGKIESQIRDAIRRGHDVQLHLHPNWLPELGACYRNGNWEWDWKYASCNEYPHDLSNLVQICKEKLEAIVNEEDVNYHVKAFRAGAYRVQPFERIAKALVKNEIFFDTSVYRGGKSDDRGYNFTKCKSCNMPYIASDKDPQKKMDNNLKIIEMPITTWRKGERWFLDNDEAEILGKRFLGFSKHYFKNNLNFFVMIGHSKGEHDYEAIEKQLRILAAYPETRFVTLSQSIAEIENNIDVIESNSRKSIQEVEEIMKHLYDTIEPENGEECDKPYGVLQQRKALCCGYAMTLYKILKQYGYHVKCLTIFAHNMPNGRGTKKIDTHELVELKFNGKYYLLDSTTNTIIPHSIKDVLKNPQLAVKKMEPDSRYIKRRYCDYDTSFFYERVIYYIRRDACEYKVPGETYVQCVKRILYVYLFHVIPGSIKHYNIYIKKRLNK